MRQIKAAGGSRLSCLGWRQQAVLSMLMNNPGSFVADHKLQRVLIADPGSGIRRQAYAGYERAVHTSNERSVDPAIIPY